MLLYVMLIVDWIMEWVDRTLQTDDGTSEVSVSSPSAGVVCVVWKEAGSAVCCYLLAADSSGRDVNRVTKCEDWLQRDITRSHIPSRDP